jgi:hypothetical protein
MTLSVRWIDHEREPQAAANPAFPKGIDVDVSAGQSPVCIVTLPWPAKRCGVYLVACDICGFGAAITTAGRLDDPRSLTAACLMKGTA